MVSSRKAEFVVSTKPHPNRSIRLAAVELASAAWKRSKGDKDVLAKLLKESMEEKRQGYCIVLLHRTGAFKVVLFQSAPPSEQSERRNEAKSNVKVNNERETADDEAGGTQTGSSDGGNGSSASKKDKGSEDNLKARRKGDNNATNLVPRVIHTDLSVINTASAMRIAAKVAGAARTDVDAAEMFKSELVAAFGSPWHVASSTFSIHCKVMFEEGYFIHVRCGKYSLVAWRHEQKAPVSTSSMAGSAIRVLYLLALVLFAAYHYHKGHCPTVCKSPSTSQQESLGKAETQSTQLLQHETVAPSNSPGAEDAICSAEDVVAASCCEFQQTVLFILMVVALGGASFLRMVQNVAKRAQQKEERG